MKGFELNALNPDEHIWDVLNEGVPFFLVELPGGEQWYTRQMKGFPIQFGREVNIEGGFGREVVLKGIHMSSIKYTRVAPFLPGHPTFGYIMFDVRRVKNPKLVFQFQVLASGSLLNVPERVDWKDCSTDKDTETEMTAKFRELFKPCDFTLEDDE